MGLQWEEMGEHNLGDVFFFLIRYCIWGKGLLFLIILKWLIKVPGHIPILFRWFLELPKSWLFFGPVVDLYTSFYHQKYPTNTRKYGIILNKYYFFIYQLSGSSKISQIWTHRTPTYFDICCAFSGMPPPNKNLVS